ETVEDRASAWREPVAHLKALGETELLQLAHVALERLRVLAHRRREVAGSHCGTITYQPQHGHRPAAVMAGGVESRELSLHLGQLGVGHRPGTAQRHTRVGAGEVQPDAVHGPVRAPGKLRGELVAGSETSP